MNVINETRPISYMTALNDLNDIKLLIDNYDLSDILYSEVLDMQASLLQYTDGDEIPSDAAFMISEVRKEALELLKEVFDVARNECALLIERIKQKQAFIKSHPEFSAFKERKDIEQLLSEDNIYPLETILDPCHYYRNLEDQYDILNNIAMIFMLRKQQKAPTLSIIKPGVH